MFDLVHAKQEFCFSGATGCHKDPVVGKDNRILSFGLGRMYPTVLLTIQSKLSNPLNFLIIERAL